MVANAIDAFFFSKNYSRHLQLVVHVFLISLAVFYYALIIILCLFFKLRSGRNRILVKRPDIRPEPEPDPGSGRSLILTNHGFG